MIGWARKLESSASKPEQAVQITCTVDLSPLEQCCGVCSEDDTVGDLKKLVAAQTGTRPDKIRIQKWYTIYKDHITLADYEIHDGMGLELYYN